MNVENSLDSAEVSAHPQQASVSSATSYTVTVYRDPRTLKRLAAPMEFKHPNSDEAQEHARRLLKAGLKKHDFMIQAPSERLIQSVSRGNRLIVAVEGSVGDWAAYEGKVNDGIEGVRLNGDKISEEEARILFPDFKNLRWRR